MDLIWRQTKAATVTKTYDIPEQMTHNDMEMLQRFIQDIIDERNSAFHQIADMNTRMKKVSKLLQQSDDVMWRND